MILAIDIGNTNIAIGGFYGEELRFVARISTDPTKTADEYSSKILHMLSLYGLDRAEVLGAIISSVVPPLNAIMSRAIRTVYGVEPLLVGPGIKTGLGIHCDNPASVGSDLICACVAAHNLYGSPSLIVDMGTATKMMVVDKGGAFIGVSIMPGVMMGLLGLSSGTAQLPQVSLDAPSRVIGKNTADCMKSGAIYGNAAMIDGMIDRFIEEYGEELPVYATGGYSHSIIKHCKHEITIDENLVLLGLYIIYKKNAG
ncbi:MAG: type III pantothenate kinase [Clostridia bacterium]|nr:type III pantothenate kinase [Clostridia bacterium]